jgi:hypothetical protein
MLAAASPLSTRPWRAKVLYLIFWCNRSFLHLLLQVFADLPRLGPRAFRWDFLNIAKVTIFFSEIFAITKIYEPSLVKM